MHLLIGFVVIVALLIFAFGMGAARSIARWLIGILALSQFEIC